MKALVQKLNDMFHDKFSKKDAENLTFLITAYEKVVSEEELLSRNLLDLYGSIVSFWKFIYKKPDALSVSVYNPTFEQHGWVSRHTVIQIVSLDSPFIVDTLMMLMSSLDLGIHFMMNVGGVNVKRNKEAEIVQLKNDGADNKECFIIAEVDRQSDELKVLEKIEKEIISVYEKLSLVVNDFGEMRKKLQGIIDEVKKPLNKLTGEYYQESVHFLEFLRKDHFIFLGYCEFNMQKTSTHTNFEARKNTALGLFSLDKYISSNAHIYTKNLDGSRRSNVLLTVAKSEYVSPIHRPVHMDIISLSIYNDTNQIVGCKRFLGLYTSTAYHSLPQDIPFLRLRKQMLLKRSGFRENGHAYKALSNIIDTYPRDELLLSSDDELFKTSMGIYHIRERQVIKLFVRQDQYSRYYFCMLYLPRDRYNSAFREGVEKLLLETFNGKRLTFKTNFLESILCRIIFTIYIDDNKPVDDFDIPLMEEKICNIERQWTDDLFKALIQEYGENKGRQFYNDYKDTFSPAYRDGYPARNAIADILHFEKAQCDGLSVTFNRVLEENLDRMRFKLYLYDATFYLSNVMPILENFGLCVVEERPYKIQLKSGKLIWMSDFGLGIKKDFQLSCVMPLIKEAFRKIWFNLLENDRFNSLIIYANLKWREVSLVRSYVRYLLQIGIRFSQSYIAETFIEYGGIIANIVKFFHAKFDPSFDEATREKTCEKLLESIQEDFSEVVSLDQDKILRKMLEVVQATVRTNFYQLDENAQVKEYIVFKITPRKIPDMIKPIPMFEIFMNSPKVEGLHLRSAKVARGGLRWSDRKEDYRTEILGLVKAQQVKNAVIVPLGAKGGFLPKKLPIDKGRNAVMDEAVECYKTFISALLDVTDNIKNNKTVKPAMVRCYDDEDDSYLVVAADKGTSSFSDIANEVAQKRDFWLGDAFASGGSNGYDHKKLGITARGAWESAKRHFRERGKDIQSENFTVVGIGDMSGDVFGNGMLLSEKIKLIGAFNHMHIFIDPDPDPQASFKERYRLFKMERSSWQNYDKNLISKGGGVFSRRAKTIIISDEIQSLLNTTEQKLEPNELIRLLLKAKVELLWSAGIGTYVKSSEERNVDVGDRANDAIRIDAKDLRCKVVCEGGNLGFTQLGRIEYALRKGAINTDAIDNSAGVDCSDHEVNIKILLNHAMESEGLSLQSRNKQLVAISDELTTLVLQNNYHQNKIIASELHHQNQYFVEAYTRLLRELESKMQLDREIEFLPTDKEIYTRSLVGVSITAPELSVIMAYTKIMMKQRILKSTLPDCNYFEKFLQLEFPVELIEKYGHLMEGHKLKREIIATQLINAMVLKMGLTFVQRMYDETGASIANIVKAFCVISDIFDIDEVYQKVYALDNKVKPEIQQEMLQILFRFIRRNCRWILSNEPRNFSIDKVVGKYKKLAQKTMRVFPKLLINAEQKRIDHRRKTFIQAGASKVITEKVLAFKMSTSVMDLMIALKNSPDQLLFEKIAILLNQKLLLSWFRTCINSLGREQPYWGVLSISALRDDLDKLQYTLVKSVVDLSYEYTSAHHKVLHWIKKNKSYIKRWSDLVSDIKTSEASFESINIAFRSLQDLVKVV